jgi:peptidoglycan/LPS O-acetylase OafA/YrhL
MAGEPNPYAPPATDQAHQPEEEPTTDDAELDALIGRTRVTATVRGAAATAAGLGGLLLATAVQLWGLVQMWGVVKLAPYLMLALGVTLLLLAAKVYRQRPWAAVTVFALSLFTALCMALWFLLSTASGFLSLLALLVPLLAVVAAVFSGLAIRPCRQTAAARRQLAVSGIQVDFG